MAVSLADAQLLTIEFCRLYPVALELAFKFRRSTVELYEELATLVPRDMQGGYLPVALDHGGRRLLGRVDIPIDNIRDGHEFVLTLRHEVLGHFGSNTFTPAEKRSLLEAIIAARREPTLRPVWDVVDRLYTSQSELLRAEEVFALVCESVTPPPVAANRAASGQAAFDEAALARRRLLTVDDLVDIGSMVAHGLATRTREQRNFPRHGEVLERTADMEAPTEFGPAVLEPGTIGPGLIGTMIGASQDRATPVAVKPSSDVRVARGPR